MKTSRDAGKKRKAPSEGTEKRQRVSLACEYCRSRKQRCDSARPSCSACAAAGQQCVYDEKIRRRGLVPGYVRVLECLYGSLFSRIDSSENAIANLLIEPAIWPADSPEEGADQGGDTDTLFQRWKKSKVCQIIENKLNDNELSIDNPAPVTPAFERGLNSLAARSPGVNPIRDRGTSQLQQNHESVTITPITNSYGQELQQGGLRTLDASVGRLPDPQVLSINAAEALTACTGWERANAIAASGISLVLPSNSWRLFDIFFTFTSSWLPLVERRHIFKTAELYQGDVSVLLKPSGDRCGHSILWAVMAYASFQDRDSRARVFLKPEEGTLAPEELLGVASSLISDSSGIVSLEQAQALVLLSLISCGRGEFSRAWQQVGCAASAIRCQSGLPTSSSTKAITSCCYVVDVLISAKCGLRPHLVPEDAPDVDVDGVEEYERWINRTDIRGEVDVQIPRAIPQRLYSTFNMLLTLLAIPNSSHHRHDAARAQGLSDWYTNFCAVNRQALSTSGIFLSPGMAHTMMIYHFLHSSLATADTNNADIINIAASWETVFGQATLPPTFTLFVNGEQNTKYRAVWAAKSAEKGDSSTSTSQQTAQRLDENTTRGSMVDNCSRVLPNNSHARIPSQRHVSQQESIDLFSAGIAVQHQPHGSIDTGYGVSVRSDAAPLHVSDRDVLNLHMTPMTQMSSNQQQLPGLRPFDFGLAEGVDIDEWMYGLAPRPEFNDHSAFMMNLGAVRGNIAFDNMFAYTDLS